MIERCIFILFCCFISLLYAEGDSGFTLVDLQAEAYYGAQDYTEAKHLYDELLKRSLTAWQHSRILYNLGTIELAQNEPQEALAYFKQIKPEDLSLPLFANHLYMNVAIAYLKMASGLDSPDLEKKSFLIQLTLQTLAKVRQLGCQVEEQEKCDGDGVFLYWEKQAEAALKQVQQQRFEEGMKALSQFAQDARTDSQKTQLDYEILLLNPNLTIEDLQKLIQQVDQLPGDKEGANELIRVKQFLQKSLQQVKTKNELGSHFFLLAGYHSFENLMPKEQKVPINILKGAVQQSVRTLRMEYLFQLMSDKEKEEVQYQAILLSQQEESLARAKLFIPAVLKQQKRDYDQTEQPEKQCQQSPWDQVIPLFSQGLKQAQSSVKVLSASPLDVLKVLTLQEASVQAWQKALDLLLHSPKASQQQSKPNNPQDINETFRLVQEMYLEDQRQPVSEIKEGHTW